MYRWIVLLAVVIPLLGGCGGTADVPEAMPDDFRFVYAWREGSVPPPYHYEYQISVESDGAGVIEFWPDYPGGTTPVWRETFDVPAAARQQLYAAMRDAGVWSATWKSADPPRVGGSTASVQAHAAGRAVTIPGDIVDEQAKALEPVYSAIDRLVPAATWEKLRGQRQSYEDSYQP